MRSLLRAIDGFNAPLLAQLLACSRVRAAIESQFFLICRTPEQLKFLLRGGVDLRGLIDGKRADFGSREEDDYADDEYSDDYSEYSEYSDDYSDNDSIQSIPSSSTHHSIIFSKEMWLILRDSTPLNWSHFHRIRNPAGLSLPRFLKLYGSLSTYQAFNQVFRPVRVNCRFGDLRAEDLVGDPVACAVCKEDFKPSNRVSKLPCSHVFHAKCLKGLMQRRCPYCRQSFKASKDRKLSS